jgi:imidazolonepropionase-like amidohydrolase
MLKEAARGGLKALGMMAAAGIAGPVALERMERSGPRPAVLRQAGPGGSLLLIGLNLVDVLDGSVKAGCSLKMRDGRIESISYGNAGEPPAAGVVIDAGGLYAIPGLINAHCHTLLTGAVDLAPDFVAAYRRSIDRGFEECVIHGVTTVRDMGSMPLLLKRWRGRIECGELLGPRVYYAGSFINARGGYPTDQFGSLPPRLAERWGDPVLQTDTPQEVREAVRKCAAAGACVIKTALDDRGLVVGQKPLAVLSDAQLEAMVGEARACGLKVAAHHRFKRGFDRAVRSGVEDLQHLAMDAELDDAGIAAFLEGGCSIVPTVSVAWALCYVMRGDPYGDRPEVAFFQAGRDEALRSWYPGFCEPAVYRALKRLDRHYRDPGYCERKHLMPAFDPSVFTQAAAVGGKNLNRLVEAGALIGCGNDGVIPMVFPGALGMEMVLMSLTSGMDNAGVLRAATLNNARIMGLEGELGSIEKGKLADLVLLAGDPLERMEHVLSPEMVFKEGRLVYKSAATLVE